ncbi:MAG: cold shock domain-containing protein [Roseateles sp.]|uniref:cold shock domain-containing protein n=1 Tax=Roseateles sp. TaxID=1971397 RepID=UPI0040354C37
MRLTGILRSWNDERGFGFIAPTRGGAELFVHVSALPRDGTRPVVGETLSFELGRGKDGKPQAVNVVRSAVGQMGRQRRHRTAGAAAPRWAVWVGWVLLLCLLIGAASWSHRQYQARSQRMQLESQPPTAAVPDNAPVAGSDGFRCDGRTHCSQMTSCAEATWFINHCPATQMDGNHDGVPCEQQWCTAPGAR